MDLQHNRPDMSLPQPAPEAGVFNVAGVQHEAQLPHPETQPAGSPVAQPAYQGAVPTPPPAMPPQLMPIQQGTAMPAGAGAVPDDSETMIKQWVDKAKEIVEATKDDPYRQSKEISKVKAAFLKANYNKDIKIVEE